VHLLLKDGTDIILDAGTGIRALGEQLAKQSKDIHLLLTHSHWDHIQGFPFFQPIYQAKRNIFITPGQTDLEQHQAILDQMSGSYFPVDYTALKANIVITPKPNECNSWQVGSATIKRIKLNHPGGGSAYVIQEGNTRIAYVTDNELSPPYPCNTEFAEWVEQIKNADLLIHDAQYLAEDMPTKSGWWHSIAKEAIQLALASNAKQLALYSHDPSRNDQAIEALVSECQTYLAKNKTRLNIFAAAEGMKIEFDN
jgi:phosphoribosyl 1,2-cyclic phosphodiesterase